MKSRNIYLFLVLFVLHCKKETEFSWAAAVYDVFLIMGQSNTENGYGMNPVIDQNDEGILQLGRNNGNDFKIMKAIEPLDNWDSRKDRIGFGLTFAKLYKHLLLRTGRKVLLIACGKGSSGFNNSNWNKGDLLYEDAAHRTQWVMENFPGSEIKGILWQQGEQDVGNPEYQKRLDTMVVNLRNDFSNAGLPFIAGGMVPFWVKQDKARQKQEAIIEELPFRLSKVGFANPKVPFVISKTNDDFDAIHFDANGQRELGRRFFSVYNELSK